MNADSDGLVPVRWLTPEISRRALTEWLFMNTIADLQRRADEEANRYEVLGISPLLRKLLLDASPLLNAAKRYHPEVDVRFHLAPHTPKSPPVLFGQELEVMWSPGGDSLVGGIETPGLKAHQLVRAAVASSRGTAVSFGAVVKHFAHVEGGVHHGTAESELSQFLFDLAPATHDHPADAVRILIPLARVVINGVRPLCRSITPDTDI
jgi:hypothetical protein